MAKKKSKHSKKKVTKKATRKMAPRKLARKKPAKLPPVTSFMKDFKNFLTDPVPGHPAQRVWNWPPVGQLPGDSINQIASVASMLGSAYAAGVAPLPNLGATFLDRATNRVCAYGWPANPEYAKRWPTAIPAIHLWEMDRIADMMFNAMNGGAGGGGSKWPPL